MQILPAPSHSTGIELPETLKEFLTHITSPQGWLALLRHRPGHGWPLSMVAALELLAGFDNALPKRFPESKEQIRLAYELSKGRVLEDPIFLLCKEVLRVPFPAKLERPRPEVIADYMQIVR